MWAAHGGFAKVLCRREGWTILGLNCNSVWDHFGSSCSNTGTISALVVRASAVLQVMMVLVKGSLHSEVDYDNG